MDKINWQLMANKVYELGTEWAVKLLGAIIILFLGTMFIKILINMLKKVMEKSGVDVTIIGFLEAVVRISLQIILWIMVLGNLGVKTTSFIAIVGSAGLAVGLALQGSLSNIGAGVLLVILRPFKVNDFITGGGQSGTVKEIGIFNTIMLTTDNKKIIIPNSKISADSIINFSAMETRRVDFVFSVSYKDNLKEVKQTLNDIIKADPRVLSDPAHVVVVSELADSSVNFTVRAWVKASDYWGLYFETIEKVKTTFDEKGISIPFPQRDVHMVQKTAAAA